MKTAHHTPESDPKVVNGKVRAAMASKTTALHRVLQELAKLAPEQGLIDIGKVIAGDDKP